MTRAEEKLKLAEELGIEGYVATQKQALKDAIAKEEREAVIQELTSMKWKPLTKDSFKFFPKWVWGEWLSENINPIVAFIVSATVTGLAYFIGAFIVYEVFGVSENYCVYGALILTTITSIGIVSTGFIHKVEVASMPLSEWKDDLPYGALLAVKEAMESGVDGIGTGSYKEYQKTYYTLPPGQYIYGNNQSDEGGYFYSQGVESSEVKSYKIYYPRLEARRVNADPIITGLYKGIEVEIFAWDDKKIRPEDY